MDYKRLIMVLSSLYFSMDLSFASDFDSLGIKSDESGTYVLHQVDALETLYALSRRYGTSVELIIDNNQITGNSLSEGSVLKIPWQHDLIHEVRVGETLYSISRLYQVPIEQIKKLNNLGSNELNVGMSLNILRKKQPAQTLALNQQVPSWHVVDSKETLFSISKRYEIDLDDLMNWNRLVNNYVQVGDTLVLSEPTALSVAVGHQESQPYSVEKKNTVSALDVVPVKENGVAAVIDGTSDTKKYLALHRSAPVGTIMKVRNEMTNLSVFVRVVGKLPDTGTNNNVLLRLSKAAQEALGALDGKFRVELSYVPNQ